MARRLRPARRMEHAGRRLPASSTYASGTTGTPKGALNSHANVAYVGSASRSWLDLTPSEGILALARSSTSPAPWSTRRWRRRRDRH